MAGLSADIINYYPPKNFHFTTLPRQTVKKQSVQARICLPALPRYFKMCHLKRKSCVQYALNSQASNAYYTHNFAHSE